MSIQRASVHAQALAACVTTLLIALAAAGGVLEAHNPLEVFRAERLHIALGNSKDATLSANSTTLERSGDWVSVTLDGVKDPQDTDIVALFAPPDNIKPGQSPTKYKFAVFDAEYLATGRAELTFLLVNHRVDMQFVFIRGGLDAPVVSLMGPIMENTKPNEPTGIHLLMGLSPTETRVQWQTRDVGSPRVWYGLSPMTLQYSVPATTATYAKTDMCGGAAAAAGWLDPGQLHTATLTGIPPGARVWYMVGDAATEDYSERRSFTSRPSGLSAPADPAAPPAHRARGAACLLGVADQGVASPDGSTTAFGTPGAWAVATRLAADVQGEHHSCPYSALLHVGDLSYARGFGAVWEEWLLQQEAVFGAVPVAAALGNHEHNWEGHGLWPDSLDSGGECAVTYHARFANPSPLPRAPYYSFDVGPMHVAVLSTEHALQQGSAQHAWLEGDLAAVRREDTPWLLVAGHRPLYVDADDAGEPGGKQAGAALLRGAVEDLLERYGVDLALSGHHHSYQRSCPVFQGVCQEPKRPAETDDRRRRHGTVHVCFGNGGAELYHNQMPQRPRWAAFEEVTKHGHVRIRADAERFQLQAVEAKTGEVFDEVVLARKKDGAEADVHSPDGVQEPAYAGFRKSDVGRLAATF